ncbi:MAG: hypothetical protein J0M19_01235 [Sphingomonadales bacterium]|nr:hypothetical protein [Sphingomonadales bacterium]
MRYSSFWKYAGLVTVLAASAAQAALPPKYQRQRELEAIITDRGVISAFPDGELIQQIRWVAIDLYRVRSLRCTVDVRIVDDPSAPAMPGPRKFLVKPDKAVCERVRI